MKIIHIILFMLFCLASQAQDFPFRQLETVSISASDELYCMYFDKDGLMWLGTNSGLKSYDGYQIKTYKSSAFLPGILPNNNIRSITEDHYDCLWIGTRNGLVRMNKRTGEFKTFYLPYEDQRIIYTLFTSKDGTLWVGTDGGLSYFNSKKGIFYTYNKKNSWVIDEKGHRGRSTNYSVKSIVEDRNGDILIGTWSNGLMRLKRGSHTFQRYPRLNASNSAYSLFFDKFHRLWVGTWGFGVIRIDNPNNIQSPQYHQYPYTTKRFDTYYKFVEDPVSNKLWACTREGVCFLDEQNPSAQWQCYNQIGSNSLNFNNDIATDGMGKIWLCTQNFGILTVSTNPSPFKVWNLNTAQTGNIVNYISSLQTSDGNNFWLGLNPYGLALYNRQTGHTLYNKDIPGFSSLDNKTMTTSISCICPRSNGELWFANNNYGIIVKPKGKPAILLNHTNTSFMKEDYVNTIYESRDKTLWIGHRNGLGIVYANNHGAILTMKEGQDDFSYCDIRNITQDKKGNIWLATDNEGIIRVSGNPSKPSSLKYKQYNPIHHNFAIDDAVACHEDKYGRLWAISNSGGLFLYDKGRDCFIPKNREYHIPGERSLALNEDVCGNLWLTTDKALVQVNWGGNFQETPKSIICYSKEDGIGDILFATNATCQFGKELFFGNRTSILSFTPAPTMEKKRHQPKLVITDLLIDDVPFSNLDSVLRKSISSEMPLYTRSISILPSIKKFDVEFSLLTYGNTQKDFYAYRLEGYDEKWQYCSGDIHHASFQNLPSGTYRLYVKATDSYGQWLDLPYTITIRVLPPWYASKLAYMVYMLIFIGALLGFARWYKEHLKTKNRLQMGVFLTNITHELLTPLTVISATIYKLKNMAPQYEEDYEVLDNNINRTTKLLRQILEVRKSQAGKLKLLVSRNDIAVFVKNACESIRPMAERQNLSLHVNSAKENCPAWFDTDKLDKILYNLLSNAIKYNKEGGKIDVSLTCPKGHAVIVIEDNGIGMSKKKLKHLYTRFFDGDYRKQNMPGTGIGLALTHDLVVLHHGTIKCESSEGIGTSFTIDIPICKSAFSEKEIEKTGSKAQTNMQVAQTILPATETTTRSESKWQKHSAFIRKGMNKILVVEDNKELLDLMYQMLSKKYHVLTAKNGKQAMNIIMKEQLDLVVSDVMMPIMDGIELTKLLKGNKHFWQLPIILLTAKNKEEDKTEGYATGADAYITKPFKFEDLEVRIDTLITNHQKIKESFSQIGNGHESEKQEDAHKHFSDPDKVFIDKATKLVQEHLDDADYDRDTFANDMAMGASTLYNKIKATTGQTVVGFIMGIRLKEARRIMESNPDILISEVALRVGFNTPKYFSKCFKKEFGMFPREYAEELKKK